MRVVTSVKSEHILISFAASRLFEDVLSSVAIAVASFVNVERVQNYAKQTGDSQPKASGKGEGEACSKSQNESKGSEGLHRQERQSIVQIDADSAVGPRRAAQPAIQLERKKSPR